jgi:hypothetical protein
MVIITYPQTGEFGWVSIRCHGNSWQQFFAPNNIEDLEAAGSEDLALPAAEWVQGAIDHKFQSLSNQPLMCRT